MVEDAVYNIACLAFFASSAAISRLAEQISFPMLESYFPYYEADNGTFYTSHYSTSPFLGGRRDIYYLMFDVAHFSRLDLSEELKQRKIAQFRKQLYSIESGINSFYDTAIPSEVREKYMNKYKMHALCLRIWVAKWQNPNICSSAPTIRGLVGECLELMETSELLEHMNPALCWVMEILMCAANEHKEWLLVEAFVNRLRGIIDFGHGGRMWKVLELVHKIRQTTKPCHGVVICDSQHDGLNLLLSKGGLLNDIRV